MIKNTKLRSEGVKRARELIYTAERQASRDVGLAGLSVKIIATCSGIVIQMDARLMIFNEFSMYSR